MSFLILLALLPPSIFTAHAAKRTIPISQIPSSKLECFDNNIDNPYGEMGDLFSKEDNNKVLVDKNQIKSLVSLCLSEVEEGKDQYEH